MTTPSAFQTLPLHVAEKIAFYCISSKPGPGDVQDLDTYKKRVWSVLYSVSRYWRELALIYFFSEADINVFTEDGPSKLEYPCLPNNIRVDKVYNSYVKRVKLVLNSIPNLKIERDFRDSSLAWLNDTVFCSARYLTVEIPELFDQTFDENTAFGENGAYPLIQRIQMAMPELQKVTLCGSSADILQLELSTYSTRRSGDLQSFIFEVKSFTQSESKAFLQCGNMSIQNSPRLTKLECELMKQDDDFGHIIRKSAPTLVSLRVVDSLLSNARLFIFDEENESVVYPRLRVLSFSSGEDSITSGKLSVNRNIVLFPTLQFLIWSGIYIFDNDALFRGNNSTLEKLYIRTDTGIVDVLQRYKTFADGKYSRLRHVFVWNFIDARGVENAQGIFARFGANFITPATTFFSVYSAGIHGVSRILAETRHLENIQILQFSGYNGTLSDLITLVKLLPNMTTLDCFPGKIGFESNSKQFSKFVNDIYENSYPLSHCFRRWEFAEGHNDELKFPVETALIFAILCTKFTLAYIPLRYKCDFDRKIEEFITSRQNDKYVDKTRRLLWITDSYGI